MKKRSEEGRKTNEERRRKDAPSDRSRILHRPARTGTPEAASSSTKEATDRTRARSVSPVRRRETPDPVSPSRRGRGTPPPGRSTGQLKKCYIMNSMKLVIPLHFIS